MVRKSRMEKDKSRTVLRRALLMCSFLEAMSFFSFMFSRNPISVHSDSYKCRFLRIFFEHFHVLIAGTLCMKKLPTVFIALFSFKNEIEVK